MVQRLLPVALEDEIVPLGYDVAERTAVPALAEGHAALHAARRLHAQAAAHVLRAVDLLPVAQALLRRTVHRRLARVLYEASGTYNRIMVKID